MADEPNQPTQNLPPPTPLPTPPSAPNLSNHQLWDLLTKIAQFGIASIFILYLIGYLVWFSYLGTFGIAPDTFLQISFISAAFCYLGYVAVFFIPVILIHTLFRLQIRRHFDKLKSGSYSSLVIIEKGKTKGIYSPQHIIFVYWVSSIYFWQQLYLPTDWEHGNSYNNRFGLYLLIVGLFHLLLRNIWRRECPRAPFYAFLNFAGWLWVYLLMLSLHDCLVSDHISSGFICGTLVFCITLPLIRYEDWIGNIFDYSHLKKPMIIIFILIITLVHISGFGKYQFGSFPRTIGGGMPVVAYLKLNEQDKDIAPILDFPITNDFVGPVAILLQTDEKIFFRMSNNGWKTNSFIGSFQIRNAAVNLIQFIHQ